MKFPKIVLALLLLVMVASSASAVEVIINLGSPREGYHQDCCPHRPPMEYQGTEHGYDYRSSRYSNGYEVVDVTDHYVYGTKPHSGRVNRSVNRKVWFNGHYINR